MHSRRCLGTYEGHQGAVWGVQATDQTLITASADGTVRFWDIDSAQTLHVIDLVRIPINAGVHTKHRHMRSLTECTTVSFKLSAWCGIVCLCTFQLA